MHTAKRELDEVPDRHAQQKNNDRVTMQESGVSKRVSARFDDVTDDGHIKREAIDRAAEEAEPEHKRGVA